MKINAKLGTSAIVIAVTLSLVVPALALGQAYPGMMANPPHQPVQPISSSDSDTQDQPAADNVHSPTSDRSKLTDAKLQVCQNRQQAITHIMERIANRGQKQLNLFTTIATRVEAFYTEKGKSLSNYDALVADVNAKKAAAQTEVDTVKTASTGFSCDGSDPRGFAELFKSDLKSEISALQDYRTSVKNLIVGVKSVQSTTNSGGQTNSGGNQ